MAADTTPPGPNDDRGRRIRKVLFLFPEILRPQKVNHRHMFELLSPRLHGDVFTMASQAHKGTQIAAFRLYSGRLRPARVLNWLVRLYVQFLLPLRLSMRRPRVDAIVTYDPYASGVPALVLKWFTRAKLIVQVMGDYHRLSPADELVGEHGQLRPTGGPFKRIIMNLALRMSLRAADAIKVLNRDQERFVRSNWPGKPVFRFADFAATRYFTSLDCYQGNYLLAVGHPFHRKGVDVLIRAFARIADDFPQICLRILGYAAQGELESYRALVGHHPRIEFLKAGWVEEVGEQMRGCYGLVHAARSEAMGRVLLEAMACRKPIVSTKTNGGLDYVVDGETGILCGIDDVEALASAMRMLLADPARAQRMGHAGHDHLQRTSSEERFSELFVAMVDEVAGPATRF